MFPAPIPIPRNTVEMQNLIHESCLDHLAGSAGLVYTMKTDIGIRKSIFRHKFDIDVDPSVTCAASGGHSAVPPLAPPQKLVRYQNVDLAITFGEELGEFAICQKICRCTNKILLTVIHRRCTVHINGHGTLVVIDELDKWWDLARWEVLEGSCAFPRHIVVGEQFSNTSVQLSDVHKAQRACRSRVVTASDLDFLSDDTAQNIQGTPFHD